MALELILGRGNFNSNISEIKGENKKIYEQRLPGSGGNGDLLVGADHLVTFFQKLGKIDRFFEKHIPASSKNGFFCVLEAG